MSKTMQIQPKCVTGLTQRKIIDLYKILIDGNLPLEYFKDLNGLIVYRWSVAGLTSIKEKAWKELKKEQPEKYTF